MKRGDDVSQLKYTHIWVPFRSNRSRKAGFLNLAAMAYWWATEEFMMGHSLVLLNLSVFSNLSLLLEMS